MIRKFKCKKCKENEIIDENDTWGVKIYQIKGVFCPGYKKKMKEVEVK